MTNPIAYSLIDCAWVILHLQDFYGARLALPSNPCLSLRYITWVQAFNKIWSKNSFITGKIQILKFVIMKCSMQGVHKILGHSINFNSITLNTSTESIKIFVMFLWEVKCKCFSQIWNGVKRVNFYFINGTPYLVTYHLRGMLTRK